MQKFIKASLESQKITSRNRTKAYRGEATGFDGLQREVGFWPPGPGCFRALSYQTHRLY